MFCFTFRKESIPMPLAITRKTGEFVRIVIPPSTEPQIIAIGIQHCGRGATKMLFTAPRAIEILRTEIIPPTETTAI
jgi:sRNA-binding carbon storage regulator CsrA